MNYIYQALPFRGHVERVDANAVAKQLNELINNQAAKGWEFYQINSVSINVSPGCLASLFGAQGFPMSYDMAIFRRELNVATSIKNVQTFESKIPINSTVEDPNPPAILEMKKKSEPYLNKLINLGYAVTKSRITQKTAYWEFEFTSNRSTFEINSFKELQDFANNFSSESSKLVPNPYSEYADIVSQISNKGCSVKTMGDFPKVRWEITTKDGQTRRISNIQDLIKYSESLI